MLIQYSLLSLSSGSASYDLVPSPTNAHCRYSQLGPTNQPGTLSPTRLVCSPQMVLHQKTEQSSALIRLSYAPLSCCYTILSKTSPLDISTASTRFAPAIRLSGDQAELFFQDYKISSKRSTNPMGFIMCLPSWPSSKSEAPTPCHMGSFLSHSLDLAKVTRRFSKRLGSDRVTLSSISYHPQ